MSPHTKPPVPEIAGIQDQQLSSNQQALPIPYLAGTRPIALTWISRPYKIFSVAVSDDSSKGKGGGSPRDVYGSIVGLACMGTATDIVGVNIDNKATWPGGVTVWAVGQTLATGNLRLYNSIVWKALSPHNGVATSTSNAPDSASGSTYWTEFTLSRGSDINTAITIPGHGTMRIYWGTSSQAATTILNSANNNYAEQHPDYKGVVIVTLETFLFGRNRVDPPNVQVILRKSPTQTVITGSPASLNQGQANLAAIKAEVFTSQNFVGVDTGIIDGTSFQATADALDAIAGLTSGSVLLDSQETVRSFFDKLDAQSDGYARFNPDTKLIEIGLYKHGAAPASYTVVTVDDLADGQLPKLSTPGWTEVKTRVVVRFPDRAFAYGEVSDKADDPRAFRVIGNVRALSLDRPYITRRDQALAHAIETLRSVGRPMIEGEIVLRREKGRPIRPGDYIRFDIPIEPGGTVLGIYCRVIERTIPYKGPIRFSIRADNTLTPVPYSPTTAAILGTDDSIPAIPHARMLEASNTLLGVTGNVIALAERPNTLATGFDVYFDTDPAGTFTKIGAMAGFAARAVLRSNLNNSSTTIQITAPAQEDMSQFSVSPGTIGANNDTLLCFLIATDSGQVAEDSFGYPIYEICSISSQALSSGSDYDLTVLRGRKGSTAQAFTTSNTEVWIIPRSLVVGFNHSDFETLRTNRINGSTPVDAQFRLAPFTFLGARDLADCSNIVFDFAVVSGSGAIIQSYFEAAYPLGGTPAPDTHVPISGDLTVAGITAYPVVFRFSFSATDAANKILSYAVYLRQPSESVDTLVQAKVLATPTNSLAVTSGISSDNPIKNTWVQKVGTTKVVIIVSDAKGNDSVRIFHMSTTRTGTPGPKAGTPVWTYNGTPLDTPERAAFGKIVAQPSSNDATVYWSSRFSLDGSTWSSWTSWTDQSATPAIHSLLGIDTASQVMMQEFRAYATQSGYTDSNVATVHFDDFTVVTG